MDDGGHTYVYACIRTWYYVPICLPTDQKVNIAVSVTYDQTYLPCQQGNLTQ